MGQSFKDRRGRSAAADAGSTCTSTLGGEFTTQSVGSASLRLGIALLYFLNIFVALGIDISVPASPRLIRKSEIETDSGETA